MKWKDYEKSEEKTHLKSIKVFKRIEKLKNKYKKL
jgi:hypothetical protein